MLTETVRYCRQAAWRDVALESLHMVKSTTHHLPMLATAAQNLPKSACSYLSSSKLRAACGVQNVSSVPAVAVGASASFGKARANPIPTNCVTGSADTN